MTTDVGSNDVPLIFISYSHDSEVHKGWVLEFASKLVDKGVDVILDAWNLRLGDDATRFMTDAVSRAHRVLMVCTQKYVDKYDSGKGGVGFEGLIVNGELVQNQGTAKFIPVVRQRGEAVVPKVFATRFYVDLSDESRFDEQFELLLRELHSAPRTPKPTLGKNPFKAATNQPEAIAPAEMTSPLPVNRTSPSEILNSFDEESLIHYLLHGMVTLSLFRQFAHQHPTKIKDVLPILAAGHSWSRMFANYLAVSLEHDPEYFLSVVFDKQYSYGVRVTAAAWLRFVKPAVSSGAKKVLAQHIDDDDIDNVRLVVYCAGALGDFSLIQTVLHKRSALKDDYYNEKLGSVAIEAYLDAYSRTADEWHLRYIINDIVELMNVTLDYGNLFVDSLNLYDGIRLLPRSRIAPLFRKLTPDKHKELLMAVLLVLQGSPNPYLLNELLGTKGDDELRRHAFLAAAAIGSSKSHQGVSSLDDSEARSALCFSIGLNRVHEEVNYLVTIVDGHDYYSLHYHYALWSLGELARAGNQSVVDTLNSQKDNMADGHTRAHCWLGLTKAGKATAEELKEIAELADSFVERVILGIAGALVSDIDILEMSLLAATRNLAPIWRLQSHIYRDFQSALETNCGQPGQAILQLLDLGN
jgi:hypothetical protein